MDIVVSTPLGDTTFLNIQLGVSRMFIKEGIKYQRIPCSQEDLRQTYVVAEITCVNNVELVAPVRGRRETELDCITEHEAHAQRGRVRTQVAPPTRQAGFGSIREASVSPDGSSIAENLRKRPSHSGGCSGLMT